MKNLPAAVVCLCILFLFAVYARHCIGAGTARKLIVPQLTQSQDFGTLRIFKGEAAPEHAAIFFSGEEGWTPALDRAASQLVSQKIFVVGVDTPSYRETMITDSDPCIFIAGELERLSQSAENEAGIDHYLKPFLAGYGTGGLLAYVALAQHGPPFVGSVAIGFENTFLLAKNFCVGDGLNSDFTLQADGSNKPVGTANIRPNDTLSTNIVVLQGEGDATASSFFARVPNARVRPLKVTLEEFFVSNTWSAELTGAVDLVFDVHARLSSKEKKEAPLTDLPVVEVKPEGNERDVFVVFLSGDGGWATIDKELGNFLAKKGILVVGFSSLNYFWKRKDPAVAARDVARVVEYYLSTTKKRRVVIAGFSMGAELVPFIMNRLPKELAGRTEKLVLVAPEKTADFEIHIGGWIGFQDTGSNFKVLDELAKLKGTKVLCLYGGDEEAESACPELKPEIGRWVKLPGGHHFKGDYETVGNEILQFINEPLASPWHSTLAPAH